VVKAQMLLIAHLELKGIFMCMGGSCGGHQVLEMALLSPIPVKNIMIIAASARETAWSIAIHTTQRMAIESDPTWLSPDPDAGLTGLHTARGIGLLTYRTVNAYLDTQTDEDERVDNFKAESYIRYQGEKLVRRFNAWSYWFLTRILDSHHLGRGRGSVEKALSEIKSRALILSIDTDILIPPSEQQLIASHIPGAEYQVIPSRFGHDGFLIEQAKIREAFKKFIS